MRKIIEELHDPNLPYISKFTIYLFLASQQKTIHYASFFGHQVSVFSLKKKKSMLGWLYYWRGKYHSFFLIWATDELRAKRKKQLKKDTASKIKSLVNEVFSAPVYCWQLHMLVYMFVHHFDQLVALLRTLYL